MKYIVSWWSRVDESFNFLKKKRKKLNKEKKVKMKKKKSFQDYMKNYIEKNNLW